MKFFVFENFRRWVKHRAGIPLSPSVGKDVEYSVSRDMIPYHIS